MLPKVLANLAKSGWPKDFSFNRGALCAISICLACEGSSAIAAKPDANNGASPRQNKDTLGYTEETVVTGVRESDFTAITKDTKKLVDTAGALGDPMAAIFSLPGVISSNGDVGKPAVRGSSPDDNTFLIDFMPTSYIFHEFGVSVFSEYILQDFKLHAAGYGPEFQNVTGAAFDITLRDPKQQKMKYIADISLLRSGIFAEGSITENSAFYASGRISVIDKILSADDLSDEEEGIRVQQIPEDFDYQLKYRWDPNVNNRLSVSANGAGDEAAAEFTSQADFVRSNPDFAGYASLETGYMAQNIVWDHFFSDDKELKIGLGNIHRDRDIYWGDDYFRKVGLNQKTLKFRYSQPHTKKHYLSVGGSADTYNYQYVLDTILFVCTEFDASCELSRRGRIREDISFDYSSNSIYVNDHWTISNRFKLDLGLQWIRYSHTGENLLSPRMAAKFKLNEKWSLIGKAGRYNRFPDLETTLVETGNPNLDVTQADHYTLGFTYQKNNHWSLTVEAYQKYLDKLPLALQETDPNSELRYVAATKGNAYGVDVLLNKSLTDKWYGWLSFSLSKSKRTNTLTSATVDYKLDTPLILNWVMNYQYSDKFNVGWRWTMRSGSAYTPIIGLQESPYFENTVLPEYGDLFSNRLPTYSRLDIRLKWDIKTFNKDSSIILDILNVTNRENVTDRSLDYKQIDSVDDDIAIEDEVGLGIIPALSYRISF